jgi:hypothetical protein
LPNAAVQTAVYGERGLLPNRSYDSLVTVKVRLEAQIHESSASPRRR